jgi:hypothetical protein
VKSLEVALVHFHCFWKCSERESRMPFSRCSRFLIEFAEKGLAIDSPSATQGQFMGKHFRESKLQRLVLAFDRGASPCH